ncbi:AAA family ATPase (plasmid) [Massilia forsythiae]|uniref:AAA family ATPase n=1 Tax=Massilia forsythiae TaxID=2728020 RepID=A0A7Z2ZVW2_9BURK|nr:ParA family protein [Massilia forsythiae]QJE03730.1 AAA family ATPase [Massilia forsythiae]
MYVVTFYSFKGGVGRTMSLVNVAAELAKQGKRILMVDFDLEAPGLSDFELIDTSTKNPGLVEFITDYVNHGSVPDVSKYLYKSTKYEETEDRLWVMPAGCQNGDYQSLFSSINWQDLYQSANGYLLMEDLRAQWDSYLRPDYVFIDSRTGYTDIAGICTRQLPDAVCLLFTPNKQNLTGLTKITAEIKAQDELPGLRKPKLHFVASNIPSLEDDEDVLKKALGNFSRQLEYIKPSAIIHHYNSFALINEAVFTIEYPKNPLAIEYKLLADEITRGNFQDRSTAIYFLRSVIKQSTDRSDEFSAKEVDQKLTQFEIDFSNDAEVLFWMSRARRALGSLEESEILLDAAIQNGLNTSTGFLDRAIIRFNQDIDRDEDAIWADLKHILKMESNVLPSELLWTLKLASRLGHGSSSEVLSAPSIKSLQSEDLLYLAEKLSDSRRSANLTIDILSSALAEDRIEPQYLDDAYNSLGMVLIAIGDLDKASEIFSKTTDFYTDTAELTATFNYAMARYWVGDSNAEEYFRRVIRLINTETANIDANYLQCLSFCNFAVGQKMEAYRLLEIAETKVNEQSGPVFSCWRYLEVSPKKFKEDLLEMKNLYDGKSVAPIFCKQNLPKEIT